MKARVLSSGKSYELAFEISCDLGEGPIWDDKYNRIFWVDITQGVVHWLFPDTGYHRFCKTNQTIGAIALTVDGELVAATQAGFAEINIGTGTVQPITNPEIHLTENRFNDGKCDPAGRFWAGTMSTTGESNAGGVYTLDNNSIVSKKIENIGISNGMAWSPDNHTFYHIDTATQQVAAYDYNKKNGSIKNKRVVVEIPETDGWPDGMTVDSEGMLWVALWDGGKVGRYNPLTGRLIDCFELPVSRPTSCVFGGNNLDDLYITSARNGLTLSQLENQPLAGSLFVVRNSGYRGIPANKYLSPIS